ncbi:MULTISPECIES: hypothetical protein [unclassified Streptomyces]|uniref:hypothetical protein n=1 Tax=unclassified Streptomyces TaxID=2593676 RepID=UPI0037006EA1
MSFEDPDRPVRGRRRHASARRGRGAVWLVAVGGAAVLGLGAVALTGGGGAKRPAERDADGGGLPALIQADPERSGAAPAPDPSRGASRPAAPGPSTARPSPSGPPSAAPSEPSATAAPPTEAAPAAAPTASGGTGTPGKPGRGRGNGKGPR